MGTKRNVEVAHDGTFAIHGEGYTDAAVLTTGGTEQTYNVPTRATADGGTVAAQLVVFSGSADFFANYDAAAAVPGADVVDGTASELNPTVRRINDVSVVHLVAPADGTIITLRWLWR